MSRHIGYLRYLLRHEAGIQQVRLFFDMLSCWVANVDSDDRAPFKLSFNETHKSEHCMHVVYNDATQVLLQEVISRTLKTLARGELRKFRATHTDDTILDHTVNYLNKLWGAQPTSREFWRQNVLPLVMRKYGKVALLDAEQDDLLQACRPHLCRITELTSEATPFQLTAHCKRVLREQRDAPDRYFVFTLADLDGERILVKRKPIIIFHNTLNPYICHT